MFVIVNRWSIFAAFVVFSFGATIYYQKFVVGGPGNESLPLMYAEKQDLINRTRTKRMLESDVCLSSGCVEASTAVINNMDRSVDPCEDFYEFACGNFIRKNIVNNNTMSQNMYNEIVHATLNKKRMIMTESIQSNESKPFRLAKSIYKLCMDQDKIDQQGVEPFEKLLKSAGGWPVLEPFTWNEPEFSWVRIEYKLRALGFNGNCFIGFSVGYDLKNKTRRVIYLDQPSLGLERNHPVSGHGKVDAYYNYMVDIAVMFGARRSRAARQLEDSLEFEINLSKILLPKKERDDYEKTYNPMTVSDLQNKFPTIPWQEYINNMLISQTIEQDDVIIVKNPKYFSDLENLMNNTPKRVAANYALWIFVSASLNHLTNDFRRRKFRYNHVNNPRWKECVDVSWQYFPLPLDALYVRRFSNENTKTNAIVMVNGIREELYNTLAYADWMDDETRKKAMDKAKSMSSYIAYPDELLDDNKLNDLYKNFEINESDYYVSSILNISKFTIDNLYSKLKQPVNLSDWKSHCKITKLIPNYDYRENSINLPASMLQGVFFSSDRPQYMNYGAIGSIIGHEIIHVFDDRSIHFDEEGNKVHWLTRDSKEKYNEKAKCFIEQYENYTAKEVGIKLNGINTLSENIADHGGLKQSYHAYKTWTKRHGFESRLPGLQEFSPQQMFWISAANMYCSKDVPQLLKSIINNDSHSPSRFRVIGSLSNLELFSNDFNCHRESKMNPLKKCYLW